MGKGIRYEVPEHANRQEGCDIVSGPFWSKYSVPSTQFPVLRPGTQ